MKSFINTTKSYRRNFDLYASNCVYLGRSKVGNRCNFRDIFDSTPNIPKQKSNLKMTYFKVEATWEVGCFFAINTIVSIVGFNARFV